jgi:hypothetical protein
MGVPVKILSTLTLVLVLSSVVSSTTIESRFKSWASLYRWQVTQATIAGICHRLGCRAAYAAAIDSLGGGSKTVAEITLLTNAFLIDCTGSDPRERALVLVEDGTIRELRTGRSPRTRGHDAEIALAGPHGAGARDKDRGHEPDGEPHLRHPHQRRARRDRRLCLISTNAWQYGHDRYGNTLNPRPSLQYCRVLPSAYEH